MSVQSALSHTQKAARTELAGPTQSLDGHFIPHLSASDFSKLVQLVLIATISRSTDHAFDTDFWPCTGAEAAAGAAKAQAAARVRGAPKGSPEGTLRPGSWLWELLGDMGSLLSHPVFVLTMLGTTAYTGALMDLLCDIHILIRSHTHAHAHCDHSFMSVVCSSILTHAGGMYESRCGMGLTCGAPPDQSRASRSRPAVVASGLLLKLLSRCWQPCACRTVTLLSAITCESISAATGCNSLCSAFARVCTLPTPAVCLTFRPLCRPIWSTDRRSGHPSTCSETYATRFW